MKKSTRVIFVVSLLVVIALAMTACGAGEQGPPGPAGPAGPAGPEGPAGAAGASGADASMADLTCTECHNDTAIITGKKIPWENSVHGTGGAVAYAGGRDGCAACHSGASFSKMVAEGLTPATWEGDTADVTHQDCRTCHEIHVTYTGADWALETEAPVEFYATGLVGISYDGGAGNLCATCHQPRRTIADADADGNIEVTRHYGPHLGPHSAILLGEGGAGVEGKPSSHYSLIEGTCVACHLGENDDHSFLPAVSACQSCHADLESFDFNGLQTEVEALMEELKEKLVTAGLLEVDEEGEAHEVTGIYPAAQTQALWNYITLEHDGSHGVHNPTYTKDLLEASLAAFE